jgi:hypothetical protein
VERQFDPEDVSFIPRAFSISHVNLTHRNWTAIGLPELSLYPLVDPRGLVTPLYDGWSLDCWLLDDGGKALVPSRLPDELVRQELETEDGLAVVTTCAQGKLSLTQKASVALHENHPQVRIQIEAHTPGGGSLVVALRPYNAEGVQFVDRVARLETRVGWLVNRREEVHFDRAPARWLASDYHGGDVFNLIGRTPASGSTDGPHEEIHCQVGLATAAAIFPLAGESASLTVEVPLAAELAAMPQPRPFDPAIAWPAVCADTAVLRVPDEKFQRLYDAAVRTLVLLSAGEVVPGPYTYRRFWFRDACLMLNALLAVGLTTRCKRAIDQFPSRQLRDGYFRSQEGEWDSNGQVLWILDRYQAVTGESSSDDLLRSVEKAVAWIDRKRESDKDSPHAGLLPAGFSAEHFGPNDHYYWDDFWAEAGLRAAGRIYARAGRRRLADEAGSLADEVRAAIERSIGQIPAWRSLAGIPASPYRRIDAGAIGSLVADYPLQLYPPAAPPIMATVEALLSRCLLHGGFFQDVIHSGVNAYLTLDLAQTLLRAGDARYRPLVQAVADLASPTGQWPEAIHPHTRGGCMGDGQHGWAAAEWVMLLRNCFVREEHDRLIIGSGLWPEWLETGEELSFGPTPTPWGRVQVRIAADPEPTVHIEGRWFTRPPRIDVAVPSFDRQENVDAAQHVALTRRQVESGAASAGAFAAGLSP